MKEPRIDLIILGVIFLAYISVPSLSQDSMAYSNRQWHFEVTIPASWHYTEASQLQAHDEAERQRVQFAEDAGLVVTISKFPINTNIDFNPNINISAKSIMIDPPPRNDNQIIRYAKNILLSMVNPGNNSDIEELKFNGLLGVKTIYLYQLPSQKGLYDIFTILTILIDKKTNNCFIITSSCLENTKSEYESLFNEVVKGFRLS